MSNWRVIPATSRQIALEIQPSMCNTTVLYNCISTTVKHIANMVHHKPNTAWLTWVSVSLTSWRPRFKNWSDTQGFKTIIIEEEMMPNYMVRPSNG